MKPVSEIFPFLEEPKNIVITFHQKPDADAMGSGLGLYNFLIQFGHKVTVISPTNWAGFLSWMPGAKKVIDFEMQNQKALSCIERCSMAFLPRFQCTEPHKKDGNSIDRN